MSPEIDSKSMTSLGLKVNKSHVSEIDSQRDGRVSNARIMNILSPSSVGLGNMD